MATLSPAEQAYQQAHMNEDRGPLVVRTSIALAVIMTIVVTLRCIARYAVRFPIGWDDLFCVCGLIFFLCMCAINIVSVRFGMGKHLWATDPAEGYKIIQAGFFLSIDYALTHFTIKITLLFTYLRFFGDISRAFRYAVWLVMFYVTAWALSLIITALAQCHPLSYFWTQFNISLNPPAQGHCPVRSNPLVVSTSALNLAGDFMLLILPLPMIWGLQMPLARKIGLLSIFLVGIFACVAGIFRLTTTLDSVTVGADSTWNAATVYIWTAIESFVQLFCACVPIIWPFFVVVGKKVHSSIGSGSRSGSREPFGKSPLDQQSSVGTGGVLDTEKNLSGSWTAQSDYASSVSHAVDPEEIPTASDSQIVKSVDYSIQVLNGPKR